MNIKDMVYAAGVVGCGGAGFPTHVKIDTSASTVIVNGAECEPLLQVDRQLMSKYAGEVICGLKLVMEQTGAERGVIALKGHYSDAIEALRQSVDDERIQLHLLNNYYPSGDEQQIIYAVTGRIVPLGGLPSDVSAVVCNVGTMINIERAARDIPVTEKYVTVNGAVAKPITILAPIGTALKELLAAAGGCAEDCRFIVGGPCMGQVCDDLNEPVTKTTGGLLAFPARHRLWRLKTDISPRDYARMRSICSQCSRCTQMCPRAALGLGVAPHKAMRAICWSKPDLLGDPDSVFGCCECGLCSAFACDFGLNPTNVMQMIKRQMAASGIRPQKRNIDEASGWNTGLQVPPARLMARLGLTEYNVPAPMEGRIDPEHVRIPLRMHIGKPCKPVVKRGDYVEKGRLIAAPDGLGANIHASISGHVDFIDADFIGISKTVC